MKIYKIDASEPVITISPKRSFYGQNSLLNIKITRIPYEHSGRFVRFYVSYCNAAGEKWSIPLIFEPPYYFNALTPDLSYMQPSQPSPLFNWIEIKASDNYEYVVEIAFNSDLHRNLEPFRKQTMDTAKIDFLLHHLYRQETGMVILGQTLTNSGIEWEHDELKEIVEYLKYKNFIVFQVQKMDFRAQILPAGKSFCETNSFSQPGTSLLQE